MVRFPPGKSGGLIEARQPRGTPPSCARSFPPVNSGGLIEADRIWRPVASAPGVSAGEFRRLVEARMAHGSARSRRVISFGRRNPGASLKHVAIQAEHPLIVSLFPPVETGDPIEAGCRRRQPGGRRGVPAVPPAPSLTSGPLATPSGPLLRSSTARLSNSFDMCSGVTGRAVRPPYSVRYPRCLNEAITLQRCVGCDVITVKCGRGVVLCS